MVLTLPLNGVTILLVLYFFAKSTADILSSRLLLAHEVQPLWTVASGESSTKYGGTAWQSQSEAKRLPLGLKHFPLPSRLASLEDFTINREAKQIAWREGDRWEHNSR